MKKMKKTIVSLFVIGFLGTSIFIVIRFIAFFKPPTEAEEKAKTAYIAYHKAHYKEIGKSFIVDSVAYLITDFKYYQKKDTTTLIAHISISNQTNQTKKYTNSFFTLKNGINENFYPEQDAFSVFENRTKKMVLIYKLPERIGTYLSYDLHFVSKSDTVTNAIVSFYENYREGG